MSTSSYWHGCPPRSGVVPLTLLPMWSWLSSLTRSCIIFLQKVSRRLRFETLYPNSPKSLSFRIVPSDENYRFAFRMIYFDLVFRVVPVSCPIRRDDPDLMWLSMGAETVACRPPYSRYILPALPISWASTALLPSSGPPHRKARICPNSYFLRMLLPLPRIHSWNFFRIKRSFVVERRC